MSAETAKRAASEPNAPAAGRNWFVCVDIGGTKVAVCLARRETGHSARSAHPPVPRLSHKQTAPTAKSGDPLALANQVIALVTDACLQAGISDHDLAAIGVSSCGPFVFEAGGLALAAPNICGADNGPERGLPNSWQTVPLEGPLRQAFVGVPLAICNDAVAALHAERQWGALQGSAHCAYVTWSTGVGVGLCVDGHVLGGKNGNAGHAGHMFVSDASSGLCGCGNTGDVEGLVSGRAIENRFGIDASSFFIANNVRQSSASGQYQSQIDELGRVMGRMMYNLAVSLDLERIAIGGSVFLHQQAALLPLLQAQFEGRIPALLNGCHLLAAGLGAAVGDHAALAVAINAEKQA